VSKARSAERVPLTAAALALGISYWAARDRVLRGELDGGRDANYGRWFVVRTSLESAVREKARKAAEHASA
jgi:hypothetical protein